MKKKVARDRQELDLSYCWIDYSEYNDYIPLVCCYLNGNSEVSSLHLVDCNIGIKDIKSLELIANTNLTTLYVWDNSIGDEGARALSLSTTLTTLDVGENKIGDEGARALSLNTTLTTLNVRNNKISQVGAKALAANTTLKTLVIRYNNIGPAGAKALVTNTSLTKLNMSDMTLGGSWAKRLASNKSLTSLNIERTNIGYAEEIAFVGAMRTNMALVNLSRNFCNKPANEVIDQLLIRNKLIHSYPQHVTLILAAYIEKELSETLRTKKPLSLSILCALTIIENAALQPKQQQNRIFNEIENSIPNDILEILANLRSLSNELKKTLQIVTLPHYGIDKNLVSSARVDKRYKKIN